MPIQQIYVLRTCWLWLFTTWRVWQKVSALKCRKYCYSVTRSVLLAFRLKVRVWLAGFAVHTYQRRNFSYRKCVASRHSSVQALHLSGRCHHTLYGKALPCLDLPWQDLTCLFIHGVYLVQVQHHRPQMLTRLLDNFVFFFCFCNFFLPLYLTASSHHFIWVEVKMKVSSLFVAFITGYSKSFSVSDQHRRRTSNAHFMKM